MRRAGRPRAVRVVAVARRRTAGAVVGLSACSTQGGQDLAQQACVHVHRSVAGLPALHQCRDTPPAAAAPSCRRRPISELRVALPLAAAANSDDGSWNSLMTTISEGATVDEGHLVPSLRAQCVVADANPNVNPQSPTRATARPRT